jgi:hypothetical protein
MLEIYRGYGGSHFLRLQRKIFRKVGTSVSSYKSGRYRVTEHDDLQRHHGEVVVFYILQLWCTLYLPNLTKDSSGVVYTIHA